MWAIKCNPDKMILFSSFLVVLVVCLMLLCEDGEDYTEWLMENVADLRQEEVEQEVRILCLVMTQPNNHKTKALQVSKTWGRRCSHLRFLTTQSDDQIETFVSNTKGGFGNKDFPFVALNIPMFSN